MASKQFFQPQNEHHHHQQLLQQQQMVNPQQQLQQKKYVSNVRTRPNTAHNISFSDRQSCTSRESLSPVPPISLIPTITKTHITSFTPEPLTTTTITSKHYNIDLSDQQKLLQQQQLQQQEMQLLQEQCRKNIELVQQQQLQYKKMLKQNKQHIDQLRLKEIQQHRQNKLEELEQRQQQLTQQFDEHSKRRDFLQNQLKKSGLKVTGVYPPEYFVETSAKTFKDQDIDTSQPFPANNISSNDDNYDQRKMFNENEGITVISSLNYQMKKRPNKINFGSDSVEENEKCNETDVHHLNKKELNNIKKDGNIALEETKKIDKKIRFQCTSPKITETISTQTNDIAETFPKNLLNQENNELVISEQEPFSPLNNVCVLINDNKSNLENGDNSSKPSFHTFENETKCLGDNSTTPQEASPKEEILLSPPTLIGPQVFERDLTNGNLLEKSGRVGETNDKPLDISECHQLPSEHKNETNLKHETDDNRDIGNSVDKTSKQQANVEKPIKTTIEIRQVETNNISALHKSSSLKYKIDSKPPTPTRTEVGTPKTPNQSHYFRLPTPELKIHYQSKETSKNEKRPEDKNNSNNKSDFDVNKIETGKKVRNTPFSWGSKKSLGKKDTIPRGSVSEEKTPNQKLSSSQKIISFLSVKGSPVLFKKFSRMIDGKRERKKSADILSDNSEREKVALTLPKTKSTSELEHTDDNTTIEKTQSTLEKSAEIGANNLKQSATQNSSISCPLSAHNNRPGSPNFKRHQRTTSTEQHFNQLDLVNIKRLDNNERKQQPPKPHFVIVAIDFGTTYSGYAFSFVRDPNSLHIMRRWEGGDPGLVNQKTLTTLLLEPSGNFHSFGFTARDHFHDLDHSESKKWLYFEKFKMALHHNVELNKDTTISASNGQLYPALKVFSHSLKYFKDHALQELTDQSETSILNEDIRWVITVPAIWKAPAKQFMRQAAYLAGLASPDNPGQLLIALEPEAASIYVRKLRTYQLVPESFNNTITFSASFSNGEIFQKDSNNKNDSYFSSEGRGNQVQDEILKYQTMPSPSFARVLSPPTSTTVTVGDEVDIDGTRYMVVDCGGGTVDITIHEMEKNGGCLRELHRATGGPYGSIEIDQEFESLLAAIFGREFINLYKTKRPSGWVDLMTAFESRKRSAHPLKTNPLNIALPFSFIEYFKKHKNSQVETAIRKYGNKDVTWSSQGMLRLTPDVMKKLFTPTVEKIKQSIGDVLNNPNVRGIKYMFLVGGFAESGILQNEIRKEFGQLLKIIIPQDVSTTILKGAVCFGLDPTVVSVRRCRLTYGVGVLNRFVDAVHPESKLVVKDGVRWCRDVLDKFVIVDQPVSLGDVVVRSYTPADIGQKSSFVHIYCTEKSDALFVTDPGVKRCGTLCLDVSEDLYRQHVLGAPYPRSRRSREIQTSMTFGDTEIKVTAIDIHTRKCVKSTIDFLGR